MKLNYPVLSSKTVELGLEQFTLNLDLLYKNTPDIDLFNKRWNEFFKSDSANKDIMRREGNKIIYMSESVIPEAEDSRPTAIFVFGNPAPHSVKAGTPFASEGSGSEHRIWKVLKKESLLNFNLINSDDTNSQRKIALHSGKYESPYKICFVQYFSMPSTPSCQPWTGVGGLFKLFGSKAIKVIEQYEILRIQNIVSQLISDKGLIITFQKDAFNGLINKKTSSYSAKTIRNTIVDVPSRFSNEIRVIGAPPTRLLYSKSMQTIFRYVRDYRF